MHKLLTSVGAGSLVLTLMAYAPAAKAAPVGPLTAQEATGNATSLNRVTYYRRCYRRGFCGAYAYGGYAYPAYPYYGGYGYGYRPYGYYGGGWGPGVSIYVGPGWGWRY